MCIVRRSFSFRSIFSNLDTSDEGWSLSRIGISSFFFLSLYLYSLYLYGSISVVARVLNRSLQRVYFGRCSYYIRFFQRSDTQNSSRSCPPKWFFSKRDSINPNAFNLAICFASLSLLIRKSSRIRALVR